MKKSNLLKLVYIAIIVFSLLPTTKLRAVDDPIPLGTQQINSPKTTYTLLAPIGNLKEINTTDIGKYLNTMFLIIIGLCGALAVIMIVIGGVQYMGTESVFGKTEAKGKILSAILGLLIALGSYAILRTIDPALTGEGGVAIDQVESEIRIESYPEISAIQYQKITGKQVLPKSQYVAMARSISKEVGINECLLIATVTSESSWKPNVMGSDADFPLDIPSRRAFINSGKKYSGASFTAGDTSLIKNKSFKNDTSQTKTTEPKIDWRFSAGFGMLGITFFPEGYFSSGYEKKDNYSLRDKVPELDNKYPKNPKTGKKYTPIELLDAENSLRLGAILLKEKSANCKDPYTTLNAYNTGRCSTTAIHSERRACFYNQCSGIAESRNCSSLK